MKASKKTVNMEDMNTMIANGVTPKMADMATGLKTPTPVQMSKAEAAKAETKSILIANGVDEEMADMACN
ncbi:hypothetical protein [Lactobacillus porci]|uniref:Uncharacterized protein n=1 Tax=Lactobacillus porci TaxID=2012477 RepID=A0A6A8M9X1_9LACO|nr:hypothetical protein [Lactobacillus porci]MST86505.1 hypothetical protein [Lactobacillus porci]